MNILIIGDPRGQDDEGMKRVNAHLKDELLAVGHHCIIDRGLSYKTSSTLWDKIVFTAGPTANTLRKVAMLRALNLKSEIILCGLMPRIPTKPNIIMRKCVNKVVSKNPRMLALAKANKIPVIQQTASTFSFQKFLRGRKRSKVKRLNGPLRILHVGHLNKKRNVTELATLCKRLGYSLTFLISGTEIEELDERNRLLALGAHIISEYQSDLFNFYRQYDLYAFPVKRSDAAIAMPLSIIEALLAGLNVISTDFGEVAANFGDSPCVQITNNLHTLSAHQFESITARPIMKLEELKRFDTSQFAQVITCTS